MTNTSKLGSIILLATLLCFSAGTVVLAQNVPQVQTSAVTNLQNISATLNGNLTDMGSYGTTTVYFQWGTSTSYGTQTTGVIQSQVGSFNQPLANLTPYTTYHFRAVAQNSQGTVYGQDVTFNTGLANNSSLIVNAGPDLYLTSGQTVTLQGSAYEPNGYSSLNYSWSCNGGSLSNYNIAQPTYTAPYSYNNQTNYTCTLTVSNMYGSSNSDSLIVFINYNNNVLPPYSNSYVQTTYATYIANFQATLNGSLSGANLATNYVFFQWGTTTNYGNETPQQAIGYSGSFMQNIANLNPGTAYHFRAVARGTYGTIYGQDMTFTTSGTGSGYTGTGALSITKKVTDITSGNLNWQPSITANPSDVLSFSITLQAGGQDVHNVIIHDILPANLLYKGNLIVNSNSNYGGDITSGITIGTISANQAVVVSYQAQVAPAGNFSFGTTALSNNATITSSEAGNQTGTATVIVNKALVYGASTVSTGLTNNFLTDSFFLPLLLIILGLWFYFSGEAYVFADWIKSKI